MSRYERAGPINLAGSASSSTGAGEWISLRGVRGYYSIQCSSAAGSTGFTIQLQGKVDAATGTTGVVTLVTCGATDNGVPQFGY
jgi:hypothetical protein